MHKARVLSNRKGFSTELLVLLAAVFLGIVITMSLYITSEKEASIETARDATKGSRLDLISAAVQADFYNNLLQTELEDSVAGFMAEGTHIIDPKKSFKSNLGSDLESYVSNKASLTVFSDAGNVYSTAYNTIPSIECVPEEVEGGIAGFRTVERPGGILELTGSSVGQRLQCRDEEDGSDQTVSLMSRAYRVNTRAIAMFNKAVQAINSTKSYLDLVEGVKPFGSWAAASPIDQSIKSEVMNSWNTFVGSMNILSSVPEEGGILLKPGSIRASPRGVGMWTNPSEFNVVCYGSPGNAQAGQSSTVQTCRPEGMELVVGKEPNQDAGGYYVPLDFQQDQTSGGNDQMQVSVSYKIIEGTPGITLTGTLSGPAVSMIADMINSIIQKGGKEGYVSYSSSTHLCNAFKGKPSSAVVSGTTAETNPNFLPAGWAEIKFDFQSAPQAIDTSRITNDFTCDLTDSTVKKMADDNVFILLTGANMGSPQIVNIGVEPDTSATTTTPGQTQTKIKDEDVATLQRRINDNPLFTSTNTQVTLSARVGTNTPTSTPPTTPTPQNRDPTVPAPGETPSETSRERVDRKKGTDGFSGIKAAMDEVDTAVTDFAQVGNLQMSENMSKVSNALCKMIGLKNWMERGDIGNSLRAICGITRTFKLESSKRICGLAGLQEAIESGSLTNALYQLGNVLDDAGFQRMAWTAEGIKSLEQALKSGKLEEFLRAASALGFGAGNEGIGKFLAAASSLVYNIQNNGDAYTILSTMFVMMGDQQMAGVFNSMLALDKAVDSGDAEAMLKAVGQLAGSFGYQGITQAASWIDFGRSSMAVIGDLDNILAECEQAAWDLVCVAMPENGGVCESNWGSCSFSFATPAIDKAKLCNDFIFDLGFQLDCQCFYTCPSFPYAATYQKSIGLNLTEIAMMLNPEQYADRLKGTTLGAILAGNGDILNYCKLDP